MNTAGKLFALGAVALVSMPVVSSNELGSLEDARKSNPAVFICGNVVPYTVLGKDGYAFAGEAEQSFTGSMAESDAELYQEARLAAKGNLVNFLQKKNPGIEVSISGIIVMYQFPEGKLRRVVCFVEKDLVSMKKTVAGVFSASPKTNAVCKVQCCKSSSAGERCTNRSEYVKISDVRCVACNCKTTNSTVRATSSLSEKIIALEAKVSSSPSDCLLRCRLARALVKCDSKSAAAEQYEAIFKIVIADEHCDKTIAAESLMEGAQFFEDAGAKDRALKFYRFLIRCNDLRRWKMDREISIANAKIADLLLN